MPEETIKKAAPVNDALRLYRASRARINKGKQAELEKAVAILTGANKTPAKLGRPPNPPKDPPPPDGDKTQKDPPPPDGSKPGDDTPME